MSNSINEITSANFKQTIKYKVVLVDFWAPWCAPCKMQSEILQQVAKDTAGKVKIVKFNIDDGSEIAGGLGISAIPTLVLYKNGKEISRMIGLQTEEKLISEISSLSE